MSGKKINYFIAGQYIIIALLIVLCIFLFIDRNNSKSTKTTEVSTSEYDVSMMNTVTVKEALKLFEDGKKHFLYIGRSTCGVCKKLLPTLQTAQKNLGYKTDYLDITSFERDSDEWKEMEELLDVMTMMNITNKNGEKETVSNTYGYFIGNYGYTPSLIIINNKKMIDGHIGNISLDDLTDWLQSNGIG